MSGKRGQEAQPEDSPGANVQKFLASTAQGPAREAPPQAAAGAEPAPEVQPARAAATQGNNPTAQPFAAAESAAPVAAQAPGPLRANPVSTAFGDMVALLAHKHFSLADLEWLSWVALNQFALADAKLANGQTGAGGFLLLGAGCSRRRCQACTESALSFLLQPNEWPSGDIFWIIDGVGEPKTMQNIIAQLANGIFERKPFKNRFSESVQTRSCYAIGSPASLGSHR